MKRILLSFFTLFSFGLASAQSGLPQDPTRFCPIDIKSNLGGGNCKPCQNPNDPSFFQSGNNVTPTAVITLIFRTKPACDPRLIAIIDQQRVTRRIRCGTPSSSGFVGQTYQITYCIYGTENNDNFFNQPNLTAVLRYECDGTQPLTIACTSTGTQVPVPEEIPLPVSFRSFTAGRSGNTVNLRWETATEDNNRGFFVQRNTGNGWNNVTFISSKANGGNSTSTLNYEYADMNTERVVTQYRILQVDYDGKSKVSDVRIVRSETQENKVMVFPNPSKDGNINILFDDSRANRDVIVSDMSGRIVKQYTGVTTSNLRVDNLMPGVYSLRIVNQSNGKATIEKVVINR